MKSFFIPKDIQKLLHISYRQLQYWDRTNFIKPSYRRKGKYRLYVFRDLVLLEFTKRLRNLGFSIQQLRQLVRSLRSLLPQTTFPMVDLTILVENDKLILASGDVLMSGAASKSYLVFKVSDLRDKIDDWWPDHAPEDAVH